MKALLLAAKAHLALTLTLTGAVTGGVAGGVALAAVPSAPPAPVVHPDAGRPPATASRVPPASVAATSSSAPTPPAAPAPDSTAQATQVPSVASTAAQHAPAPAPRQSTGSVPAQSDPPGSTHVNGDGTVLQNPTQDQINQEQSKYTPPGFIPIGG